MTAGAGRFKRLSSSWKQRGSNGFARLGVIVRVVSLVAAAAFLVAVTVTVWTLGSRSGGFSLGETKAAGLGEPLLMGALMLCGIGFGTVYNELRDDADNPFSALRRALVRPALYRSLLVAPIVFAGVYTFSRSTSDPVVVAIFAFQNGFFCEAVFRKSAVTRAGGRRARRPKALKAGDAAE